MNSTTWENFTDSNQVLDRLQRLPTPHLPPDLEAHPTPRLALPTEPCFESQTQIPFNWQKNHIHTQHQLRMWKLIITDEKPTNQTPLPEALSKKRAHFSFAQCLHKQRKQDNGEMHAFKIKIWEDGNRSSSIIKGLLSPYLGIIQREYSDGKILHSLPTSSLIQYSSYNKRESKHNKPFDLDRGRSKYTSTYYHYFNLHEKKKLLHKISEQKKREWIHRRLSSPSTSPKKVTSTTCFDFGMLTSYVMTNTEMRLLFFPYFELVMLFCPSPLTLAILHPLLPLTPRPFATLLLHEMKQKI